MARGAPQEPADLGRLVGELVFAGLDARHVENVVDNVEQEPARGQDVADIFVTLGRQRPGQAAGDEFGIADDGIERRPKLVAHIRQEFRFGAIGLDGVELLLEILPVQSSGFRDLILERGHGLFEDRNVESDGRQPGNGAIEAAQRRLDGKPSLEASRPRITREFRRWYDGTVAHRATLGFLQCRNIEAGPHVADTPADHGRPIDAIEIGAGLVDHDIAQIAVLVVDDRWHGVDHLLEQPQRHARRLLLIEIFVADLLGRVLLIVDPLHCRRLIQLDHALQTIEMMNDDRSREQDDGGDRADRQRQRVAKTLFEFGIVDVDLDRADAPPGIVLERRFSAEEKILGAPRPERRGQADQPAEKRRRLDVVAAMIGRFGKEPVAALALHVDRIALPRPLELGQEFGRDEGPDFDDAEVSAGAIDDRRGAPNDQTVDAEFDAFDDRERAIDFDDHRSDRRQIVVEQIGSMQAKERRRIRPVEMNIGHAGRPELGEGAPQFFEQSQPVAAGDLIERLVRADQEPRHRRVALGDHADFFAEVMARLIGDQSARGIDLVPERQKIDRPDDDKGDQADAEQGDVTPPCREPQDTSPPPADDRRSNLTGRSIAGKWLGKG